MSRIFVEGIARASSPDSAYLPQPRPRPRGMPGSAATRFNRLMAATCMATRPADGRRITTSVCRELPVIKVNNYCATGSTALFLARQGIASGVVDSVLALGFEQMVPGVLPEHYLDGPSPLVRFIESEDDTRGASSAPAAIKLFGAAAIEFQRRYGVDDAVFASMVSKARVDPKGWSTSRLSSHRQGILRREASSYA